MDGGFVGSDENSQFDKIVRNDFERPHDCMDVAVRRIGGRATQEQLPRDGSVRRFGTACFEPFAYMDVGGRAMQEQLPRPEVVGSNC